MLLLSYSDVYLVSECLSDNDVFLCLSDSDVILCLSDSDVILCLSDSAVHVVAG